MSDKILLPRLVTMLAEAGGCSKKQAEAFIKAYFSVIASTLEDGDSVKIKGLGTFKLNRMEARKSVNVSTGDAVRIPAHYKISFTPAKSLADAVNEDFAWLEIVELTDSVDDSDSDGEKLGEEIEKEFGEIEPVEPFGPVDPDDPEPGAPIPEEKATPAEPEPVVVPFPVVEPVVQPVAQPVPPVASPQPVAQETPVQPAVPADGKQEVVYLTKEELAALVTKTDIKTLQRSVKRLRNTVTDIDSKSKKRTRNVLIWSILICAALLTGGFFLIYNILSYKLGEQKTEQVAAAAEDSDNELEVIEVGVTDTLDSEGAMTPGDLIVNNDITETDKEKAAEEIKPASSTAATSPSDIKAMDKVTNTRYLTTMAKEHYGNYNFWPYIYKENEAKLGHPDRIKPGTTVVIPNLEKYGIDPNNPKDLDKARKLGVEIYKKFN